MIKKSNLLALWAIATLMTIPNKIWSFHNALPKTTLNISEQNNIQKRLNDVHANIENSKKLIDEGYFYMAIDLLEKNISIAENHKELEPELAQTHFQLSMAYNMLVNVEKFKHHLDEYDRYTARHEPNNNIAKALYYSYLSRYYNMRMLTEKALVYSELSMSIYYENKDCIGEIPAHIFYENHLFSLRNAEVSHEFRIKYRDSIKSMVDEYYPEFHVKKSTAYMYSEMFILDSLANVIKISKLNNDQIKMVVRLIDLFEKESENIQNHIGKYNPYSMRANLVIALLYTFTDNFDNAIKYYSKGIEMITANDIIDNQFFTPNNYLLSSAYTFIFFAYEKKYGFDSDVNYFLQNENMLNALKESWHYYIEDRITSYQDFNTNEYIRNPYSNIQKNYFMLYQKTGDKAYNQKIFESGELAKQYSIQYLINLKYRNEKKEQNKTKYLRYEAIIKGINNKSSSREYFISAFNNIEVTGFKLDELQIKNIQKKLKSNQAIISYNDYDVDQKSLIMAHVITAQKDTVINLSEIDFEDLNDENNLINKALLSFDVSLFQEQSYKQYKYLLEPIIRELSPEIEELIITKSPNIEKQNINFNALIYNRTNSLSFRNLFYLKNKYVISTPITISTYFHNNNVKSAEKAPITIFLANNESLSPLNHTTAFINNLSKRFNIRTFSGIECNKENLLKSLINNENLIVISHGYGSNSDDIEENGIFLTDGFFSSKDISSIESNCKILVLAGCKTGVGYNSNEGQINLARAFTYSGAQNIILSSDDIDEASTLMILEKWLEYLTDGNPIARAFNLAQKDFIKESTSRKSNPLYWSNFNIIDNNGLVIIERNNENRLATILFWSALGLLFLLVLIKIRKQIF